MLFLLAVLGFFIASGFEYPYFVTGLTIIAVLSFLDDLLSLSAKIRLPFQFIAVGLLLVQVGLFTWPFYIGVLVVIIAVGFINIYNFMDGINGITGLYSLVVLGGFLALNTMHQLVDTNLIIYVMLSIVVFGYFNFRKKARMFAGDVGSISVAMVILFLTLNFMIQLKSPVVLLLLAVYGIDSGITILYRLYLKEHIMEAHRHHIYQKLVDVWKWSHLKVSGLYACIQAVINIIVILSINQTIQTQLVITIGALSVLFLGYVFVFKRTKVLLAIGN
jgi:UDP-N-acetylmuramyl pentapeptide phosphotransferase/UDP-N-acetylglucosamine-1-phosphate transferase